MKFLQKNYIQSIALKENVVKKLTCKFNEKINFLDDKSKMKWYK